MVELNDRRLPADPAPRGANRSIQIRTPNKEPAMPTPRTAITDEIGTGSHPIARLISITGMDVATPGDVEQRLTARDFFWLDLESLDATRLEQFARSLRPDALGITKLADTAR
jgi:hypothetical protein